MSTAVIVAVMLAIALLVSLLPHWPHHANGPGISVGDSSTPHECQEFVLMGKIATLLREKAEAERQAVAATKAGLAAERELVTLTATLAEEKRIYQETYEAHAVLITSLQTTLAAARKAAEHFRYCYLAGSEIEHRCQDCQAAEKALTPAAVGRRRTHEIGGN